MKMFLLILFLTSLCATWSCIVQKDRIRSLHELQNSVTTISASDSISIIAPSAPEQGDADAGYRYLVAGNAFNTGIPLGIYKIVKQIKNSRLAQLTGYSKFSINDFVIFKTETGQLTAAPGCLQCHGQQFNNEFIIGLGNSNGNFQTTNTTYINLIEAAIKIRYGKNSKEWKAAERSFEVSHVLQTKIQTQMQGPTPAQKIAEVMASHRDPVTLQFRADTSYFPISPIVIPEDVPALWFAKKRKAFTVNAMRQGDFVKHITSTSILTLKDTVEAREIYNHTKDLWAYIRTLQPPKYSFPINQSLADKGKKIFIQTCSRCHGSYDDDGSYPNEVIPPSIIGTDSLMWKYFIKYREYSEWFNKSWFAVSAFPAFTNPQPGYVPPPLDGVWITAPYFHNGSVPTIENVLNSKSRPTYWKRDFNSQRYDYQKLGWRYKTLSKPGGKKTYNTDIPGYGNYGHTFGDHLTKAERTAVIEYLKTL